MSSGKFLEIDIKIEGYTELHRGLAGIDIAVNDLRPAWEQISKDFWEEQKGIFDAEGAFAGRNKWTELSEKYRQWKEIKYPGKPILQRTGKLYASLTGKNEGSIFNMEPLEMSIGSNVAYGIYHQSRKPRKKIPRRPFLDTVESQRRRWMRIIKEKCHENINLRLGQQKQTERERI